MTCETKSKLKPKQAKHPFCNIHTFTSTSITKIYTKIFANVETVQIFSNL